MPLVLLREKDILDRQRPVDAYVRVIPGYSAFRFGVVELIAFVLEQRLLAQDGETVGEALRDEGLEVVLPCQLYHLIFAICRGILAQVHSHIQDTAFNYPDKLALGKRRLLEMQATEDAVAAQTLIVLYECNVKASPGRKITSAETLEKIASAVSENLRFQDQEPLKRCLSDLHPDSV